MSLVSLLPEVSVEVEGVRLGTEEIATLGEIRVQQRLSLPTMCELVFFEPDGAVREARALLPGSSLRVAAGQSHALFDGEITAVQHAYGPSGEREVRVRGYDLLHRLRKRQPVRTHVQVTVADLARELVVDLGLSVQAHESGPLWQRLVQYRQTDFEFLAEVAHRSGLFFLLRDGALQLLTLQGIGEPLPLVLGESLLEASVEINGDFSAREVSVEGWDPWRVEAHQGRATNARLGLQISSEVPPTDVGGTGERIFLNETVQGDSQAEAIAQAELDFRAASEVTMRGVAEGNPSLQPGTPVKIENVAGPLAGRYVLTAATHIVDSRKGFVSEISTSPIPPGSRSSGTVMAPGIVTSVDDPDGLGRVQASLPTYHGLETGWMEVLLPGAGSGKGLVALPDVEDQVLVLFAREDPAQGVVLGGLYGTREAPDWGVEGRAIKRYTWRTPGGQQLTLDDAGDAVRLRNGPGSYVELSPERVRLHARTGIEIEAPGQPVVIRGARIDFERS